VVHHNPYLGGVFVVVSNLLNLASKPLPVSHLSLIWRTFARVSMGMLESYSDYHVWVGSVLRNELTVSLQ
jgi:hypothetical protein